MKETSLQTFNLIASVEILGKNINLYNTFDNPLFLARDVAEWIDYAFKDSKKRPSRDVSKMIKNIDKDEKIKGICNLSEGKTFPPTYEGGNPMKVLSLIQFMEQLHHQVNSNQRQEKLKICGF